MDETGSSSRSHGVSRSLHLAQAAALGIELSFYSTSWKTYEEKFIATLQAARSDGMAEAIFGDIDLLPHREWEEKVCAKAGLKANLPLWNEPREKLVDEFLTLGFKAIVVSVNGKFLAEEFCGREFDRVFLADLPDGIDACGENGEFHTFVYDGPAFRNPVAFQGGEVLRHHTPAELGGGNYFVQSLS